MFFSVLLGARERTWNFTLQGILGFAVLHVLLVGRTGFQLSMRDCCVQHIKKDGESVSEHCSLLPLHLQAEPVFPHRKQTDCSSFRFSFSFCFVQR